MLSRPEQPSKAPAGPPFHLVLPLLSVAGLVWYVAVATAWEPLEVCRFLVGCAALWLPGTGLVYLLVGDAIADWTSRFTVSAISGYALTTLAYFAFAVCGTWLPGFERLFYPAQALLLVGVLVYAAHRRLLSLPRLLSFDLKRVDWVLVTLIIAGLLVNVRYKHAFEVQPDGQTRRFITNGDQSYYTALAYELDRHTPPVQQAIRAGVKDRAYHLLPHLTTMLLARYTGQPDMLRAHLVYEYSVMEVLMPLALFCLARRLTNSAGAGYVAVASLYVLALPMPPLSPTSLGFFYFTIHPQLSSNLEPALITGPQFLTGVLVVYGIFLGVAASARTDGGPPAARLALVTALLGASLLRFRVQCFLPLFPGLLLLLLAAWVQTRRPVFAAWAVIALAVAALQALEMRLPVYMPQTAELTVGNNNLALTTSFFNDWPFSSELRLLVEDLCPEPETFAWAWQFLCLPLFTLLNMVGLPLAVASMLYAVSRTARRQFAAFTFLLGCTVALSLLGAACIATTYDSYSVGGQMLLHVGWYLLPLLAVGFWPYGQRLGAYLRLSARAWGLAGAVVVAAAFTYQVLRPPTFLAVDQYTKGFAVSADEWTALTYMRDNLPQEAVVLSSSLHANNTAMFSGVAGRAAYLEYYPNQMDFLPEYEAEGNGRLARLQQLWSPLSEDEFARLLLASGATHLVEYAESPLLVASRPRLRRLWVSPRGEVTIWEVDR